MKANYFTIISFLLTSMSLHAMQPQISSSIEHKVAADQKAVVVKSVDCKQCQAHAEEIRAKLQYDLQTYCQTIEATIQAGDTRYLAALENYQAKECVVANMRHVCAHATDPLDKLIYAMAWKDYSSIWIYDRSDIADKDHTSYGISIVQISALKSDDKAFVFSIDCKRFSKLPPLIQEHIIDQEIEHALANNCPCKSTCFYEEAGGKLSVVRSVTQVTQESHDKLVQYIFAIQKKYGIQADIWLFDSRNYSSAYSDKNLNPIVMSEVDVQTFDYKTFILRLNRTCFDTMSLPMQHFIILHELMHIAHRHVERRDALPKSFEKQGLLCTQLSKARQSRTHEKEADTLAATHDKEACQGGIDWCKMMIQYGQDDKFQTDPTYELNNTHPSFTNRLANLLFIKKNLYPDVPSNVVDCKENDGIKA